MSHLKNYISKNFEQLFVLGILVTAASITYFVDYKLAFLNFYYLPIILAGYYLGAKKAVLGAFFCLLMMGSYAFIYPDALLFSNSRVEIIMSLVLWGSFLVLAGAVVGRQHENISDEITKTKSLNQQLSKSHESLNAANAQLKDYTSSLEDKVKERTNKLEKSHESIEALKQKVEQTLYKTMDRNVAKLIIDGQLRTEKRDVSILFTDLCSFTEYSTEQNPETVVQQLNTYLKDMEDIIIRYSGHIDKYLGDGIMAEFGAPLDYDKHVLLAVLAALKMQNQVSSNSYPWKMRVGISSGMSILGMIGSQRQSYTSIGDTVNLAARLEAVCPPGSILIDKKTLDQVADYVEFKKFDLGTNNKIKGFSQNIELFELTGRTDVFNDNPAFPKELVDAHLKNVQDCGVSEELTLPIEALDGSIGHSYKVALVAAAIIDRMSEYSHNKNEVIQAAFAADCGKIIVNHHILNRKGRLSVEEFEIVKKHPNESVRVMENNGFSSAELLKIIAHSHERMDGRGYPDNLKGEEIPLGSRIIAVADAYSALTSERPYRQKWAPKAALGEIQRAAEEGHFDPEVVQHLEVVLNLQKSANKSA